MKNYRLITLITIMVMTMCVLKDTNAQQPVSGAGRLWQGGATPVTPSVSFSPNRDVWNDTIQKISYVWSGSQWRLSPTQFGKGAKGDTGTQGVAGVCPTCPPSGGANIGGVRWVTTWAELLSALDDNAVRSVHLAANITQTAKWRMPTSYTFIKEIEGHGFTWNIPNSLDTGITRYYSSLTNANQGIDMQLRVRNVIFSGNNNVGMYIEANYGSEFKGCRFYSFSVAMDLRWCMGTIIDQCYFWENYIGINLDYARFSGGSNSASQSNHCIVSNCKFRSSPTHFAPIKATAASGLVIYHNIFEGGTALHDGSQYEVYFDDANSNVVKEVNIYGNHVEQKPSVSAFHIKLKDGNAYVGGIYSQYDCTLITLESTAYAKMIVDNIPYLTSGTKFNNINSSGRWKFINVPATFTITDATKWVGAIPLYPAIDSFKSSGQSNYLKGISVE
jgi:hypothetical protein